MQIIEDFYLKVKTILVIILMCLVRRKKLFWLESVRVQLFPVTYIFPYNINSLLYIYFLIFYYQGQKLPAFSRFLKISNFIVFSYHNSQREDSLVRPSRLCCVAETAIYCYGRYFPPFSFTPQTPLGFSPPGIGCRLPMTS